MTDPEAALPNATWMLGKLRDELDLLAAPAADQLAWLTDGGFPVDEMALQYEDTMYLVPQLVRTGHLGVEAAEAIGRLDRALSALSAISGEANAALWTEAALDRHEAWVAIRELARRAAAAVQSWPT